MDIIQQRRRLIPGEVFIDPPDGETAARLQHFRPYVRQSGDDWRKIWQMKGRKLLDYLLVFIPEGTGIFTVAGNTFPVEDGSLVWIPPDTIHEMCGTSSMMRCLFVHFDLLYDPRRSHWDACIPEGTIDLSEYSELMHPQVDDPEISRWSGSLPVSNQSSIQLLLETICVEHRRAPRGAVLQLSALMLQLLAEIIKGTQAQVQLQHSHWDDLQEASSEILEQSGENLDVAQMAKNFGLSTSHFRRLFREIHGVSPRTMHRQAKIRRACELLVYTKRNVSEVADALGYSNVHNFSRAFREVTSMSPSEYRKGR